MWCLSVFVRLIKPASDFLQQWPRQLFSIHRFSLQSFFGPRLLLGRGNVCWWRCNSITSVFFIWLLCLTGFLTLIWYVEMINIDVVHFLTSNFYCGSLLSIKSISWQFRHYVWMDGDINSIEKHFPMKSICQITGRYFAISFDMNVF